MFVKHEKDVRPADLSGEKDVTGVELLPLITEKDGAKNFSMRLFRLSPGRHTPFHVHPWEHEVFVVQGTGELIGKAETLPLEPGLAAYVPENERHRFKAGGSGMVFLCCIPHIPEQG